MASSPLPMAAPGGPDVAATGAAAGVSVLPVTLVCAVFSWLTPRELVATHATSRDWKAAAEHPHTFRAQIQVTCREKTGVWSSGPRVLFTRAPAMRLALSSALFGNMRIVHLVSSGSNNLDDMLTEAKNFRSLHTLRVRSDFRNFSTDSPLGQLLTSSACRYLAVLILELPQSALPAILKNVAPSFPESLQHLQLTLVNDQEIPTLIQPGFAAALRRLPNLRTVVVAAEKVIQRNVTPLAGRYILRNHPPFTTEADLTELLHLAQSPSLETLRWMVETQLPTLAQETDGKMMLPGGAETTRERLGLRAPLSLDTVHLRDISLMDPLESTMNLLANIAPQLRSLDITLREPNHMPELNTFQLWSDSVRSSLRSLTVQFSHNTITVEGQLHFLTAAGLGAIEHLSMMLPEERASTSSFLMGQLFDGMPRLASLETYNLHMQSFASFGVHTPSLRTLVGTVIWPTETGVPTPSDFPLLTHWTVNICSRDERHRLSAELAEAAAALPMLESFRWNTSAWLSRGMLRVHAAKIRTIQNGFKQQEKAFRQQKQDAWEQRRTVTRERQARRPCRCPAHTRECVCRRDDDDGGDSGDEFNNFSGLSSKESKKLSEMMRTTLSRADAVEQAECNLLAQSGDVNALGIQSAAADRPTHSDGVQSLADRFRAKKLARAKKNPPSTTARPPPPPSDSNFSSAPSSGPLKTDAVAIAAAAAVDDFGASDVEQSAQAGYGGGRPVPSSSRSSAHSAAATMDPHGESAGKAPRPQPNLRPQSKVMAPEAINSNTRPTPTASSATSTTADQPHAEPPVDEELAAILLELSGCAISAPSQPPPNNPAPPGGPAH